MLSTHLIDEVADLLEHVVLLDHGRVVLDAPADDVRGTGMTVSGPATAVEEFVAGRHESGTGSGSARGLRSRSPTRSTWRRRPAPARCT